MSNPSLYVGILETNPTVAKVMYVAERDKSVKLGRLYMLMNPGSVVKARMIEGRSFSKYDLTFLQYLYWNMTNTTPSNDYPQLIKDIVEACKKLEVTEVEDSWLSAQLANYEYTVTHKPDGTNEYEVKSETKPSRSTGGSSTSTDSKPKKTGTTVSMIWEVASEQYINIKDLKELRSACKAILVDKEGVNESTFSVQFSKWKKENAS